MTNSIKVKQDKMHDLAKLHKLNPSGMAQRIGVQRQTYVRAMAGENVSAAFVAGATLGFGIPFDALFYSVTNANNQAA